MQNSFKSALHEKQPLFGLWQALASPYTAEICAGAGFDWLLFDGEHGPSDVPLLLAQLQAVASYPVHAVARPPVGEAHVIKQYLDIGFRTLLIPMVDTPQQARAMVSAVRYPPRGVRGVGAGIARAARWGRDPGYLAQADDSTCLLLQIESRAGLEQLEAIAAVDGVDGLFIGPADLSASLGFLGNSAAPEVQAAIEDAIARIVRSGRSAGILSSNETLVRRYLALGCSFIAVGSDAGQLASATSKLAAHFQSEKRHTGA